MIAVSAVTMFCLAAIFPIEIISEYDKNRGRNDQQNYIGGKEMFYC